MSGGWGQKKMMPQEKEDVGTDTTHHFHTVAETGSSCSYPHGKTLPSGHSQTQGPGHTVSNRQQLASVLGTPVMKDGPLRVLAPSTGIQNCTGHGAGLLWFLALSWPCFSVLCWPSVVLSSVLALSSSQSCPGPLWFSALCWFSVVLSCCCCCCCRCHHHHYHCC